MGRVGCQLVSPEWQGHTEKSAIANTNRRHDHIAVIGLLERALHQHVICDQGKKIIAM